ncbi:unnamed protein product [Albugo candida]|uniref:Elicitin-like protein n=1 Tax=Albugo candida TaxID=65357 RepID=A0A024GAB1_9STRA|nr:unnamed protein product [Albugo candida]|eukprot:CCI43455.1 unnamed protein product [Albugo candida]
MMRFSFLVGSYLISAGGALPSCINDPVATPKLVELGPTMMECQEKSKINFMAQKGPPTPEQTATVCKECPDLVAKLNNIHPLPVCEFNGVDIGAQIASLTTTCPAPTAQPGPEAPSASPVSPAQPTPEAQSGPPPSPVPSPMPTTPRSMVTSPSSHPVFAPSTTTPTGTPNKHHEAQSMDNSQDGTAGSSAGTSKVSEVAPSSGNSGNLKGSSGTAPTESSPVNSKGTDEVDDSKVTTSDDTSKTESSDSDKSDALTSSQNPSESTATDKHAKDKKPNNAPTPFSLLLATTATTAVSFALFFCM